MEMRKNESVNLYKQKEIMKYDDLDNKIRKSAKLS